MATTYATASDLTTYVQDSGVTLPSDANAKDRLINRAEFDIDSIIGPWGYTYTTDSHTFPTGTVYVSSTEYLPSSGSVLIGGQTITYTGKTETTLTGATGGTGTFIAGGTVRRVLAASGLKFDPVTILSTAQQGALKRATCAQAEYRIQMGEQFFITAQYEAVSGPDFSHSGVLPRVGPKAVQELQGYGLLIDVCVG